MRQEETGEGGGGNAFLHSKCIPRWTDGARGERERVHHDEIAPRSMISQEYEGGRLGRFLRTDIHKSERAMPRARGHRAANRSISTRAVLPCGDAGCGTQYFDNLGGKIQM